MGKEGDVEAGLLPAGNCWQVAGCWPHENAEAHFTGGSEGAMSSDEIEALIEQRNAARSTKDFSRADEIRDQLAAAGIELEDLREGTRWRRA